MNFYLVLWLLLLLLEVRQWMLWTACRTSSEVGPGLLNLWRMLLSGGKHEIWINTLFAEQRRISFENICPPPWYWQCEERPNPKHWVSTGVNGGPGEKVGLTVFSLYMRYHYYYMLHRNVLYSDICRCEESPSSPGVSSSIGDGIIEEDEDEGEEESNKKKMKEDDQEVLSLPLVARLCVCSTRKITELCNSDEERKPLHLASGAVKDRKVLGGLVPRPFFTFSHLPCAKAAAACRWNLSLTVETSSTVKRS